MGNKIVIKDGVKTYDIENQEGKVLGRFSFNPSDTSIIARYNDAVENFQQNFSDLSALKDAKATDILEALDKKAADLVDSIFNADVSSNFFSVMGPFTPLESGQYFIENVIEAIGYVIEADTGERVKKVNSRIRKHTSKYYK